MIHDFAEHQQTRKDIEVKRSAGSKGGRASAQARAAADGEASSKLTTETETETLSSTKKEAAQKRGSRVPEAMTITEDMRSWAAIETPDVDLDKRLPEFIDYWRSVPGRQGVKVDWVATWKNGMRKQQEFALRDLARNPQATPRKRYQFTGGDE
jgi:hypothetical protein